MKNALFNIFKRMGSALSGRGLAKLPHAVPVYQFIYKKLRPSGIISVRADEHVFLINSTDTGLAPPLIMHGCFAPGESRVLKKILKPGQVFADVGANIGYFSLMAARAVGPSGAVYAFEPEQENCELLVKNVEANGYQNITSVQQAVGDQEGTTTLYLRDDNLCAHSLVPRKGDKTVAVPMTTLDAYFKNKKVDVVKIDVEGAEPAVFAGAKNLFGKGGISTLVVELYPKALLRFGADPLRFLTDLAESGFVLWAISEKPGISPKKIQRDEFPALAKGVGIEKLVNLLCCRRY